MSTRQRALDEALRSFGTKGFEATSLDDLAVRLGVTKQAILHHFRSKERLLEAVIDSAADELTAGLAPSPAGHTATPIDRVEAAIKAAFAIAARRPELLGLIRETGRLGPPATSRLAARLQPLMDDAAVFIDRQVAAGVFRPVDTRLLLLAAYSAVVGIATESEVMRALGVEPTVRSMVRARRQVVALLRSALVSA
jgi:AcrR family transcriptional regulator